MGLLLALGSNTPFYQFIYDLLPPLRLLRGPGRAGILFIFAAAALLGDIVNGRRMPGHSGERNTARLWFRILLSTILVLGVLAFVYLFSQLQTAESLPHTAQLEMRLRGVTRATMLALAGISLVWWITGSSISSISRHTAAALLAIIILIDLWGFGYKLVKLEPSAPHPMWQDAREIIGPNQARVLPWGVNIFDQNGAGQVGLKSIFGYNTLEPQATIALAASQPDPRSQAYDVLGIGYVLANVPQEQYGDGERPLELIGQTDNVWVYKRQRILSQARLVSNFELITDQNQALERINQPDFDPINTAILGAQPPCDILPANEGVGTAEILAAEDGYWQIRTNSQVPSLLVISETAYPGWQVMVDGETAESLLAYTALRAVCVPNGEHLVVWQFKPTIFLWGGVITLLTLFLIGIATFKEICD